MNIQEQLEQLIEYVKRQQAELTAAKSVGVRNLLAYDIPASVSDSVMSLFQKIALIGSGDKLDQPHAAVQDHYHLADQAVVLPFNDCFSDGSLIRLDISEAISFSETVKLQNYVADQPLPDTPKIAADRLVEDTLSFSDIPYCSTLKEVKLDSSLIIPVIPD